MPVDEAKASGEADAEVERATGPGVAADAGEGIAADLQSKGSVTRL